MTDTVLSALLFPAAAASTVAAAGLARAALRYWWAQRAGQVYELPAHRLGTLLRAAGAGAAAALAVTFAVPLVSGASRSPAHPHTAGAPAPAPAPTPPAPAAGAPATLASPAGGTLTRLPDGTRVWLPPQYGYANAADLAFPVVVAHAPGPAAEADLFAAFADHSVQGLADPFVLVLPADCAADPTPLLAAVARHYRTVPGRPATAALGVGALSAPCVVREALAHPARYAAAAGVSGSYGPYVPYGTPDARPELLLASASGETAAQDSAVGLRAALRPPASPEIRILDSVPDRRRLLALVSGYLTEKLEGPAEDAAAPEPDRT